MPFRIDDYSETTSSPAERDFAMLKTCRSEAEIPPRGAYLPVGTKCRSRYRGPVKCEAYFSGAANLKIAQFRLQILSSQ